MSVLRLSGVPFQSVDEVAMWSGVAREILEAFSVSFVATLSKHDWLIPFFAEEIMPLYVKVKGVAYTMGRLNRCVSDIVGMSIKWTDYVKRFTHPGGQLKNFLVAVRTSVMARDESGVVSILNRGSKSESASGNWIHYLALFLSDIGMKGKVDCYDKGEISGVSVVRNFTVNHICDYYDGDAHEYTVVIDDASFTETPIGGDFRSKYYSLKGRGEPFLHPTEGRQFSHDARRMNIGCRCPVCDIVSQCARNFAEWQRLKVMTVMFGGPECDLIDHVQELRAKGDVFSQLFSKPSLDVQLPMDVRGVLSLSGEVGVRAVSPVTVQRSNDITARAEFEHTKGFKNLLAERVCDELVGKNVLFFGVDPRVVGVTAIGRIVDDTSHAFVYTLSALTSTQLKAPRFLWIPLSIVQGYRLTGKKWDNFYQHERMSGGDSIVRKKRYYLEFGLDLRAMNEIEWTKNVPGDYLITADQAKKLGVIAMSVFSGAIDFDTNFRICKGKMIAPDNYIPYLIDLTDEIYEYDDKIDGDIFKLIDECGIKTIRPCDPKCAGGKCRHDHVVRCKMKQRIIHSTVMKSIFVSEGFSRYEVRVPGEISDDDIKRQFLARRNCVVTGNDGEWMVQPSLSRVIK